MESIATSFAAIGWNKPISQTYTVKAGLQSAIARQLGIGRTTVFRYARRLRQAQGQQQRQRHSTKLMPKVGEPQKRSLTPRRAAWLVLQPPESREPQQFVLNPFY